MSRKQQTVVTFEVRLELPTGSNAAMAQDYIRSALTAERGNLSAKHPFTELNLERLIVKLSKKETTYA